jgi:hypothetical protein
MKANVSFKTVIVLLVSVAAPNTGAAPGDIIRMSRNATTYGNFYSYTERSGVNHISTDGRYIVFYLGAANLDSSDTDFNSDVYVYDQDSGSLKLVSRKSASAGGAKGNGNSSYPSISGDGCCVAFQSSAYNLVSEDPSSLDDVYVYDLNSDTVELISRKSASAGGAKGNSYSNRPSISEDGRYVAFISLSTNLDSADTDGGYDVYVYDRVDDTVELVSRQSAVNGGAKSNSASYDPVISGDGRYVSFYSTATNLDSADTDALSDIYIYDRDTDTLELASRQSASAGGAKGNNHSLVPSISKDGRYVSFQSAATNLDSTDTDALSDIYIYDRDTDVLELASRKSATAGGAKGNGSSFMPSINVDGRYVAFMSVSTNLDPADTDSIRDIYVYDRLTQTQSLMSKGASGVKGNSISDYPAISQDGTLLAFSSWSTNLDGPQDWLQTFLKETGLTPAGLNQGPIADAGPDQTVEATSSEGASVTLSGAGSHDPDTGDSIVSYSWAGAFGTASGISPTVALPLGVHTVTLTVTDESGLSADDTVTITVADSLPPSLNCPGNVAGTVGQTVDLGNPVVSDMADPAPSLSHNGPSNYGPGTTQVTWTATDDTGNISSCTQTVSLTYNFEGFFQPVDNEGIVNSVKNGATVPMKWRLSDYNGNLITDTGVVTGSKYVSSVCGGTEDAVEEVVAAGGTALRWDSTGQQFIYNWKTPSLPGKCVRFEIIFNDGISESALFKLK